MPPHRRLGRLPPSPRLTSLQNKSPKKSPSKSSTNEAEDAALIAAAIKGKHQQASPRSREYPDPNDKSLDLISFVKSRERPPTPFPAMMTNKNETDDDDDYIYVDDDESSIESNNDDGDGKRPPAESNEKVTTMTETYNDDSIANSTKAKNPGLYDYESSPTTPPTNAASVRPIDLFESSEDEDELSDSKPPAIDSSSDDSSRDTIHKEFVLKKNYGVIIKHSRGSARQLCDPDFDIWVNKDPRDWPAHERNFDKDEPTEWFMWWAQNRFLSPTNHPHLCQNLEIILTLMNAVKKFADIAHYLPTRNEEYFAASFLVDYVVDRRSMPTYFSPLEVMQLEKITSEGRRVLKKLDNDGFLQVERPELPKLECFNSIFLQDRYLRRQQTRLGKAYALKIKIMQERRKKFSGSESYATTRKRPVPFSRGKRGSIHDSSPKDTASATNFNATSDRPPNFNVAGNRDYESHNDSKEPDDTGERPNDFPTENDYVPNVFAMTQAQQMIQRAYYASDDARELSVGTGTGTEHRSNDNDNDNAATKYYYSGNNTT